MRGISWMICLVMFTGCVKKNTSTSGRTLDFFIGTRTTGDSEGIYKATLNLETGGFDELLLMTKVGNPSFLDLTKDGKYLLSVAQEDEIRLYAVEKDTLLLLDSKPSFAQAPCHVSINQAGNQVTVANYNGARLGVYDISNQRLKNGRYFEHFGSGPNEARQEAPHPHSSHFYEDKFLFVADLGIDEIVGYPIENGILGRKFTALKLQPGDGPRHMTFHENRCFIINELSNTVVSADIDLSSGKLSVIDRKGTLPSGFTTFSKCADIHITSDGQFLYGSNRGHNSLAMYAVDESGKLTSLGQESTQGEWPRNFMITPDDKFVLVANARTNNVTSFRISDTGQLIHTGEYLQVSDAICLKAL